MPKANHNRPADLHKSKKKSTTPHKPVSIVMGSRSDLPRMQGAADALQNFGVAFDIQVVSAHRTPRELHEFAESIHTTGCEVVIAGAGGAAHLPGMIASLTPLPVIGVPCATTQLDGFDSLLSIVQMPKGIPVATVAVDGSWNAGVLAVQMLSIQNPQLRSQLLKYKEGLRKDVLKTAQIKTFKRS